MDVRFQLFFKELSGIGGVVFYKDLEMEEKPKVGYKLNEGIRTVVERTYDFSSVSGKVIEVTALLRKESASKKFKGFGKLYKASFDKAREFVIREMTSKGWSYSG